MDRARNVGGLSVRRTAQPPFDRGRPPPLPTDPPPDRLRYRLDGDDDRDDAAKQPAADQSLPRNRGPAERWGKSCAAPYSWVPGGVGGLRYPGLSGGRFCAPGRGSASRICRGRLLARRGRPARRRDLSVHAAQADLPGEVPVAVLVSG